jgi:hypothetical protein
MAAQTVSNRLPPNLEYTNTTREDVDAEVMAEARRIVSS